VYLVSPETAAAAALTGEVTDPRNFKRAVKFFVPAKAETEDSLLVYPPKNGEKVEIRRGPNIVPLPEFSPLPETDTGKVLLKAGDNVTTDDIMPAGAKVLPLRSNIPAIARYVFAGLDPEFWQRAQAGKGGYIVGGENYGQGSSREHAALAPRYLGVRAVLVKSFARIHLSNLINFGILPLTFQNAEDYSQVSAGDNLSLPALKKNLLAGQTILVKNETTGKSWEMKCALSARQLEILSAGGFLNWLKNSAVTAV
jgi:aconitate hydratase